MFLIMSAAYIEQELRAEFGLLPPAFLPLGNKRLFQHQVRLAPKDKQVFLSIPQSYQIQEYDKAWLEDHNVTLLAIPDNLSIGESLIAALALSSHLMDAELSILYGDTLLSIPNNSDVIAVAHTDSAYNWASINHVTSCDLLTTNIANLDFSSQIISGYFHFSSPIILIQALSQTHWDFLKSLNLYNQTIPLSSVTTNNWLDFGHVNTYYRSKATFTTQRSFNSLKINSDWIEKSSSYDIKIQAESHWFQNIPNHIKHFTPQYLGDFNTDSGFCYRLEYLYQCALNELFVFARLPEITWKKIFEQLSLFIQQCSDVLPEKTAYIDDIGSLFTNKTMTRLTAFCKERDYDIDHQWSFNDLASVSLQTLLEESSKRLPKTTQPSVMHGDFCFSNILYDFRKNKIKTIDPRGVTTDGNLSIYGFVHYDIAKVSHSVLGLYDWIIAGYYRVKIDHYHIKFELPCTDHLTNIQSIFINTIMQPHNITETEIYAMQVQLFLSMLPLHGDDTHRQDALLSNAFRLYYKMLETEQ